MTINRSYHLSVPQSTKQTKRLFFQNSFLFLTVLSITFYARIFCSVTGAPSVLIHAHLILVPLVCFITLITTKIRGKQQLQIIWLFLTALFWLFTVMIASCFLNEAGLINGIFQFLMLGEPFILLLIILCLPSQIQVIKSFKKWVIWSSFANMIFAFIQWPLLRAGMISAGGLDATDGMAGVFFVSGAGNYVSATISMYFGLYYLFYVKNSPLWLRWVTLGLAFFQLLLSDSKQVLFALIVGWFILIFVHIKDIQRTFAWIISFLISGFAFYWCTYNLEAFAAFKNYIDRDGIYAPDGAATLAKTAAFRIIPTYYESFWNGLLGLGPGHTVTRLGGWLLQENWNVFGPLGATIHPASGDVLSAYYNNWLAMESTMFAPLFGWAGIWGDLGFIGLTVYLLLFIITWHYLCFDGFSKFLLLTVIAFGFIFTQMEEPGYMLYTFALIGLRWHERRSQLRG
ncbi:MAG: hypothetical protein RI580_07230 [Halothece sp. Uz-M2-17]|nr:hypothetical protein [Halothece sp. Uz-M2-17]